MYLSARLATTTTRRALLQHGAAARSIFTTGDAGRVPLAKIVATIGPASEDAVTLPAVVDAGMSVMRVNFSHATDEEVQLRLKNLALTSGLYGLDGSGMLRSVMLDTKGPEIRTGGLQAVHDTGDVKAKIQLTTGDSVTLTHDEALQDCGTAERLFVSYPSLATTVSVGGIVLLDDGAVSLEVTAIEGKDVVCLIKNDGEIASRRGVNLPGAKVDLPAMSDKDKADIAYGIENDMDFVAASFVRKASDIVSESLVVRGHVVQLYIARRAFVARRAMELTQNTNNAPNTNQRIKGGDPILDQQVPRRGAWRRVHLPSRPHHRQGGEHGGAGEPRRNHRGRGWHHGGPRGLGSGSAARGGRHLVS